MSPLNHNHPTVLIVYENIRTTPQDSRHQDTTTRLPRDPVMCLCYLLPLMTHDSRWSPSALVFYKYVRTYIDHLHHLHTFSWFSFLDIILVSFSCPSVHTSPSVVLDMHTGLGVLDGRSPLNLFSSSSTRAYTSRWSPYLSFPLVFVPLSSWLVTVAAT